MLQPRGGRILFFFDRHFFRSLMTVSIPIMMQLFVNNFVNMLDTFMIGRLGEAEIGAAGLGNQIFFLLNLLLFAVSSSASAFAGQFWGRKNITGIQKTTGVCLITAITAGTVFTVLCLLFPAGIIALYTKDPAVIALGAAYLRITAVCFIPFSCSLVLMSMLRSIEQVKTAVTVTFIALSCNGILNFFLIFGYAGFPRLGLEGAAIATVISRFVELIVLLRLIKKHRYPILGTAAETFRISAAFIRNYFSIAAPVILNEVLWSFGITMHNKIFAGTGTASYAAFAIMVTAAQLSNVIFISMGNGGGVLIAKIIGESSYHKAESYAKQLGIAAVFMSVCGIIGMLFPLSVVMPLIFKISPESIAIMQSLFLTFMCFYPFRAFNVNMVVGVFRAAGDARFCLFYDVFFMWTVAIPLGFYAASHTGMSAVLIYACLMSEEILKMPFGIWRLRTGKWLRSVID